MPKMSAKTSKRGYESSLPNSTTEEKYDINDDSEAPPKKRQKMSQNTSSSNSNSNSNSNNCNNNSNSSNNNIDKHPLNPKDIDFDLLRIKFNTEIYASYNDEFTYTTDYTASMFYTMDLNDEPFEKDISIANAHFTIIEIERIINDNCLNSLFEFMDSKSAELLDMYQTLLNSDDLHYLKIIQLI